jgi:glycosyltransferase involved in cell wall biosynthesis
MVLPLLDTTGNLAVLEAISCGLPIVVSDVGGIRDYLDSSCASFAAPKDAKTMANHVLQLLQNPKGREELSEGCRKKALSFDWHRIAEQMKELYESI